MMSGSKTTRKRHAMLDMLATAPTPVRGETMLEALHSAGIPMSPRTVRLYLKQLQDEGLVQSCGRAGYRLTDRGQAEQGAPHLLERVGYMTSRIDQITYAMGFDLELRAGTVAVNTAMVTHAALASRLPLITQVFEKRFAMGTLLSLLGPGDTLGEVSVPDGMLGLCTVCSVTLNGVLLKHGVPTRSLFSGLLEIVDDKPVQFSELINYDGTSIDPLELFIRSGMTNYVGAVTTGTGRIGAGFREVPAEAYELVVSLADRAERIGLGGFLQIGHPNETLFNIPVRPGSCGAVVIGGLNPVAILEETGERVQARAMAGMLEFHRLFPFQELAARLDAIER